MHSPPCSFIAVSLLLSSPTTPSSGGNQAQQPRSPELMNLQQYTVQVLYTFSTSETECWHETYHTKCDNVKIMEKKQAVTNTLSGNSVQPRRCFVSKMERCIYRHLHKVNFFLTVSEIKSKLCLYYIRAN